jgi:8-oxo-dGTP diphosphatase
MTLQIKKYVLGFAFWRDCVALIYKTKGPSYVISTWNGIGGKVEEQDDGWIEGAMMREFAEETHLVIGPDLWKHFATQKGSSWDGGTYELHCLAAEIPNDFDAAYIKNTEGDGETVQWFQMHNLPKNITPNLSWLLPLATDKTTGYLEITEQ